MNRFTRHFVAAAFGLLLIAAGASAQTPTALTVVSGNGQLICQSCLFGYSELFFRPMVVKAIDTNGAPLANVTVNWAVTNGGWGGTLTNTQTTTDQNGITSNTFTAGTAPFGTLANLYQQTAISATAGSASASFTLTQAIQPDLS